MGLPFSEPFSQKPVPIQPIQPFAMNFVRIKKQTDVKDPKVYKQWQGGTDQAI